MKRVFLFLLLSLLVVSLQPANLTQAQSGPTWNSTAGIQEYFQSGPNTIRVFWNGAQAADGGNVIYRLYYQQLAPGQGSIESVVLDPKPAYGPLWAGGETYDFYADWTNSILLSDSLTCHNDDAGGACKYFAIEIRAEDSQGNSTPAGESVLDPYIYPFISLTEAGQMLKDDPEALKEIGLFFSEGMALNSNVFDNEDVLTETIEGVHLAKVFYEMFVEQKVLHGLDLVCLSPTALLSCMFTTMTSFEDYQILTETNPQGDPSYVFSNPVLLNNSLPHGVPVVFLAWAVENNDRYTLRVEDGFYRYNWQRYKYMTEFHDSSVVTTVSELLCFDEAPSPGFVGERSIMAPVAHRWSDGEFLYVQLMHLESTGFFASSCPAQNSDIVPERVVAILPGYSPVPAVLSMVEIWGDLHFSPAVDSIGGLPAEGTYVISAAPDHPDISGFGLMDVPVGGVASLTSKDVPPLETDNQEAILAELGLGEGEGESEGESGGEAVGEGGSGSDESGSGVQQSEIDFYTAGMQMAFETYGGINIGYPVGWSIAEDNSDERYISLIMVKGGGVDAGFDTWDTPLPANGGWLEFSLFVHNDWGDEVNEYLNFDTAAARIHEHFCDNGDVHCESIVSMGAAYPATMAHFSRDDYPNDGLLFMFSIGYNTFGRIEVYLPPGEQETIIKEMAAFISNIQIIDQRAALTDFRREDTGWMAFDAPLNWRPFTDEDGELFIVTDARYEELVHEVGGDVYYLVVLPGSLVIAYTPLAEEMPGMSAHEAMLAVKDSCGDACGEIVFLNDGVVRMFAVPFENSDFSSVIVYTADVGDQAVGIMVYSAPGYAENLLDVLDEMMLGLGPSGS